MKEEGTRRSAWIMSRLRICYKEISPNFGTAKVDKEESQVPRIEEEQITEAKRFQIIRDWPDDADEIPTPETKELQAIWSIYPNFKMGHIKEKGKSKCCSICKECMLANNQDLRWHSELLSELADQFDTFKTKAKADIKDLQDTVKALMDIDEKEADKEADKEHVEEESENDSFWQ